MAVEPETNADKDKLGGRHSIGWPCRSNSRLQSILTLARRWYQAWVSCTEVLKNRMERDFNLKIRVHRPRVTYKETFSGAVDVNGLFGIATSPPAELCGHAVAEAGLLRQWMTVVNDLPSQQVSHMIHCKKPAGCS